MTSRRLLILTPTGLNIGGTERHAVTLARAAAAQGWQVRCVYPAGDPERTARLLTWCQAQGVTAETTPALRSAWVDHDRRAMLALAAFVRAVRPAVVQLNYISYVPLKDVLAIRLGAPLARVVVESHTVLDAGDADVDAHKLRTTALAARLCHRVVVHSRAALPALVAAGVPKRKLVHIPYAVPEPEPETPPLTREAARAQLGLPAGAFVVGTACRLRPEKGVADLIAAVAQVPDPDERLHLVIAGDGPERAELERLAAERLSPQRLHFLGLVSDTRPVYAALDVFALASTWQEAFGLVYVEAAHFGVPSIGTRVGGVAEAVVDSETGLLVPPSDPEALAAAIERLRADAALRRQLGEAARARARTVFSVERMADEYASVFGTRQ